MQTNGHLLEPPAKKARRELPSWKNFVNSEDQTALELLNQELKAVDKRKRDLMFEVRAIRARAYSQRRLYFARLAEQQFLSGDEEA